MATRVIVQRPWPTRARRWARANLFSNRWNTLLTVVTVAVVGFVVFAVARFVLVDAQWEVVLANRRLIFLGRFPRDDEWRVWPPVWLFLALAGCSVGAWGRIHLRGAVATAVAVALLFVLLLEGGNALRLGLGFVVAVVLYALARFVVADGTLETTGKRVAIAGWLLLLPFTLAVLVAFDGAPTSRLGGFLLNVLLAAVGIEAALPIGILLALGRASSLPAVRIFTTAYIEVVRGAPLIAWLFVAWFVLPDFLPPVFNLDRMNLVLRAMFILAVFTGAYIAEIVRGGLQSLPRGQVEAAQALGMSTASVTLLIVLPQALRAVIPALVGQMISLWKDTTLVSILGLTDGLGGAEAAVAQRAFFGRHSEVLLFAAAVFWVVAVTMSRLSARLERSLGVGER